MGLIYIEGRVSGAAGQEATLEFLIDIGLSYSLIPYGEWQSLGLEAQREEQFRMIDGTLVSRNVSHCHIALPEAEGDTPVILGEPGDDQPILGAVTLENMGLMLNPFSRTLHPLRPQ